jgi:hypothetical protein
MSGQAYWQRGLYPLQASAIPQKGQKNTEPIGCCTYGTSAQAPTFRHVRNGASVGSRMNGKPKALRSNVERINQISLTGRFDSEPAV